MTRSEDHPAVRPSLLARLLKPVLRWLFHWLLGGDDLTPQQARHRLDVVGALCLPVRHIERETASAANMDAEWLSARDAAVDCPVILYLHGGGYMAGSIQAYRQLASHLARAAKARCLIINYRLAPEHPYPAALDDAVSAYQWLIDQNVIDPGRIVIAGDSAGGGLSIATCLRLQQLGHPLPAGIHCMSPWADLSLSGHSLLTKQKQEVVLTNPQMLHTAAEHYAPDEDRRNPLISPAYADLKGLPPLLIHTGTDEVLLDDSVRLQQNASACGVDCQLKLWPGMWHVWQFSAPLGVREARLALAQAGAFIATTTVATRGVPQQGNVTRAA